MSRATVGREGACKHEGGADENRDLCYEGLPSEAVATLKKLFLATVATALAGITLGAGCAEVM